MKIAERPGIVSLPLPLNGDPLTTTAPLQYWAAVQPVEMDELPIRTLAICRPEKANSQRYVPIGSWRNIDEVTFIGLGDVFTSAAQGPTSDRFM